MNAPKLTFKEKIGHWIWNFQNEMFNKESQFAILDCANRMQKGEGLLIANTKPGGEFLAKLLELHYIIDAHPVEAVMLLGTLIGQEYTDDIDEHISTAL